MSKSCRSANHHCSFEVKFVIFVSEVELKVFITHKVAGVSWHHPHGHDVDPFPKAEDSLFLVKRVGDC